jgi:adenosylhomocysteine nucleosidase
LTGAVFGEPITVAAKGDGLTLASGDAFIAGSADRERLAEQAHLADMEGYALAVAASRAGVPIEIVKYVSGDADESAARDWRESAALAARSLADWVVRNLAGSANEGISRGPDMLRY